MDTEASRLHDLLDRYRYLTKVTLDERALKALKHLTEEAEARLEEIEGTHSPPGPPDPPDEPEYLRRCAATLRDIGDGIPPVEAARLIELAADLDRRAARLDLAAPSSSDHAER